jgi:hypothetical protein
VARPVSKNFLLSRIKIVFHHGPKRFSIPAVGMLQLLYYYQVTHGKGQHVSNPSEGQLQRIVDCSCMFLGAK